MEKPRGNLSICVLWFIAILIVCGLGGALLLVAQAYWFASFLSSPRDFLRDKSEWPDPIAAVFEVDEIEVYGGGQFLDTYLIAQVVGHDDLIGEVILKNGLLETDSTHPKATALIQEIPSDWAKWKTSDDDRWYATKDFGIVHLEGQDLFLVVTNAKTKRSVIYYNWIF